MCVMLIVILRIVGGTCFVLIRGDVNVCDADCDFAYRRRDLFCPNSWSLIEFDVIGVCVKYVVEEMFSCV
jgi:hypothetical protein